MHGRPSFLRLQLNVCAERNLNQLYNIYYSGPQHVQTHRVQLCYVLNGNLEIVKNYVSQFRKAKKMCFPKNSFQFTFTQTVAPTAVLYTRAMSMRGIQVKSISSSLVNEDVQ